MVTAPRFQELLTHFVGQDRRTRIVEDLAGTDRPLYAVEECFELTMPNVSHPAS